MTRSYQEGDPPDLGLGDDRIASAGPAKTSEGNGVGSRHFTVFTHTAGLPFRLLYSKSSDSTRREEVSCEKKLIFTIMSKKSQGFQAATGPVAGPHPESRGAPDAAGRRDPHRADEVSGTVPAGPEADPKAPLALPILRLFRDGRAERVDDPVIREVRRSLWVDGAEETRRALSPGYEAEWAIGVLRSRGRIERRGDLESIRVEEGRVQVRLRRPPPGPPARARHLPSSFRTTPGTILSGIEWIQEEPLYRATGAVHVTALIRPDGTRLIRIPDVGRHNAADKALGWATERDIEPAGLCAITSGRLPEDLVAKFAAVGVPLVASVSAATAEGIRRASAQGMTLIGFCRGERMNVYCGAERLFGDGAPPLPAASEPPDRPERERLPGTPP